MPAKAFRPVEKLVELKTLFRIARWYDRTVGLGVCFR